MKDTHIIMVGDAGTLKAYRITETSTTNRKKVETLKKITYSAAHTKLSDQVSDRAGRFRGSGSIKGNSRAFGEDNHLFEEMQRKSIAHLANDIEAIMKYGDAQYFYLSLPKKIHNKVLDAMSKGSRTKITRESAADLTKATVADLRARFKV
jgi:DNA replicative helicase MCM subunit Mcm2 (Cdc46/Mcm family)